jgi:hypothetical protein
MIADSTGPGAAPGPTLSLQADAPEWPVLNNNAGLMGPGTPVSPPRAL